MDKGNYLKELKKRLSLINEGEVSNIIFEYNEYINFKINEGLTEEEILISLGDVNELAREILYSYKISEKYITLFIGKEKVIDEISGFSNNIIDKSSNAYSKIEDSVKNVYKEKIDSVKRYISKQKQE